MVDITHLDKIKGLTIRASQQEISTTIPINDPGEDKILTEIPLALYFDCYSLFIYNTWSILGPCRNISDLSGEKIVEIFVQSQDLNLRLSNSLIIRATRTSHVRG